MTELSITKRPIVLSTGAGPAASASATVAIAKAAEAAASAAAALASENAAQADAVATAADRVQTGLDRVATAADRALAEAAATDFATFFSFAEMLAEKAIVLVDPGSETVLADVDADDGQVNFYTPVTVPAGNWSFESLAPEVQALIPFSTVDTLVLSAFRIVSADGYVLFDLSRDGTIPLDAYVSRAQEADNGDPVIAGFTDLVGAGDSMMAYGSGIGPNIIARYPTRSVYLSAESGENTAGIAVSFGIPDRLTLALTGNAIPTSGTVTVTPNISFLADGECARVDVVDATGLAQSCRVSRSGSTYSLRPATYPASAIKVQNPAPARVVSLQVAGTDPSAAQALDPLYDKTLIVRAGRNDIGWNRGYNGAQIIADMQAMAALMRSGRYLFLTPTNGTLDVPTAAGGASSDTAANCQITLDNCIDIAGRMMSAFPGRVFSPLAHFRDIGQTTEFTVNGSAYTVVAAARLADGLHENTTGKEDTTDVVAAAITSLGY